MCVNPEGGGEQKDVCFLAWETQVCRCVMTLYNKYRDRSRFKD